MTGLHVGFIAGGYAPQVGGIESHLRAVTAELIARGVRVSVLALDSGARGVVGEDGLNDDFGATRIPQDRDSLGGMIFQAGMNLPVEIVK